MSNELVLTDDDLALIRRAQKLTATQYDAYFLVRTIAQSISAPAGVTIMPADVLSVIKKASAMHLDPLAGAVYAFKTKRGNLVVGISKQGWQQALASQPDYAGVEFRHGNEISKKVHVTGRGGDGYLVNLSGYEYSTAIIKKQRPDGGICEFEGTAYQVEEFDPSMPTWTQRPRRMLDSRALTIAASNAYGWGAYSPEEVDEVKKLNNVASSELMKAQEKKEKTTGASRVNKALEKSDGEIIADNLTVLSDDEITE